MNKSFNKQQLRIDTGELEYPSLSCSIALQPVSYGFTSYEQSTMASPKTVLSRACNRETSQSSVTNGSVISCRSKYSQRSILQKSSIFTTMNKQSNRQKQEKRASDIEQEMEAQHITVENCLKKKQYIVQAIHKQQKQQLEQSRQLRTKLARLFPR